MERQRIYSVKGTSLNEADRLQIASLLIKAGYTVKIGREKPKGSYIYFVEYWEEE